MQTDELPVLKITEFQFEELISFPVVKDTYTYLAATFKPVNDGSGILHQYIDYEGIRFEVVAHISSEQYAIPESEPMNLEWNLKLDGEVREFIETDTTISMVLRDGGLATLLKGYAPNRMYPEINCKQDLIDALKLLSTYNTVEDVQ